jgi:hypothetical protein
MADQPGGPRPRAGQQQPPRDQEPVLPDRADEDRDEAWGERPGSSHRDDDWYRRERPPHHE